MSIRDDDDPLLAMLATMKAQGDEYERLMKERDKQLDDDRRRDDAHQAMIDRFARRTEERAATIREMAEDCLAKGLDAQRQGDLAEAREHFKRGLICEPNHAELHRALERCTEP